MLRNSENEPWWVVEVQGAPQQVRAIETELPFGVLLGEGRERRQKWSTQRSLIWEGERGAERQKAMER